MQLIDSFNYDFYSGANIGIYIGGHLLTTVLGIEFTRVQNKKPVWGYASQLWDGVAMGTVQCSGVIMVNFQQPQFLQTLIAKTYGVGQRDLQGVMSNKYEDTLEAMQKKNFNIKNIQDVSPADRQVLKQHFWEGDEESEILVGRGADVMTAFDSVDMHSRPFDIVITYGDAFGNELRLRDNPHAVLSQSAVRQLKGVHITGQGQTISVDGQPILDQIPFICREVI